MLEQFKTSYILKIEGKDLFRGEMNIPENRKREGALDYSLGTQKIQDIATEVLPKTKADKLFYQNENGKQFTEAVVSLSYNLNFYEFNPIIIDGMTFYQHMDSDLTYSQVRDAYELGYFKDGVYSDTVEPYEIIKLDEPTTLTKKDLPKGFKISEEGTITRTSSGCKVIANGEQLRNLTYDKGFKLVFKRKGRKDETIEYVRFLRSSGQARVGNCLFIQKRLFKPLMDWILIGLKPETFEDLDLASLEAYISLIFSSTINTIEIRPENILIIDDYKSAFKTKCMVTTDVYDGEKYVGFTEPKDFDQENKINDGQALLCSSIFEEKGYSDKGMLLLRNRFAKTCAFNTNIQTYFEDNNITEISQLNGYTRAKSVKDIKLITTPSSIKYLKFGTLEEYLDKMETTWGVVKYDKKTHFDDGKKVQTHYQLINTLEFDYETMEEFLKPSLEYMNKLKSDVNFLKEHLKINNERPISLDGEEDRDEFIFKMLSICEDFQYTKLFKTFRQNLVKAYRNNLKRGHILVDGSYFTLFGNGLEMLQIACGLFKEESLLDIDEVYTKFFDYEEVTVNSRSPHISFSNVWVSKNCTKTKAEVFDKYFNLSKQIVMINSMENNILETLSGCDCL